MPGDFFDTNVLVYLASDDPLKADRAEAVVARGGVISVQVLNEVANVARRKMRMSWTETRAFLTILRNLLTIYPLTQEIHDAGLDLAERYGVSIFDAMIAASALQAGCERLWSEDMQHNQVLDNNLRIVNPFQV